MKDFITDPATKFDFQPHEFVPFKDKKVCEYVRSLSGKRSAKLGGIPSLTLRSL